MDRPRSLSLLWAATAVFLLVAACRTEKPASTVAGGAPATGFVVSTMGNRFSPATIEVAPGQAARIQFTDVLETHTFTVSPWNVNETITAAGKPVEFVVPRDARGEVPFFCSVHAGMNGTLKVKV